MSAPLPTPHGNSRLSTGAGAGNPVAFTRGPWSVPHFARPEVNCSCRYVLCDHLMGAVASVHCSGEGDDWQSHGDNPRFDEAVANAHLIAAAPDLLEALTELHRACIGKPVGGADGGTRLVGTPSAVTLNKALKAISKALGESTHD